MRSGAGGGRNRRSEGERHLRPKSPQAEEYHERVFRARYDEYVERVRKTVLSVMILGPRLASDPLAKKRVSILNTLREHGHDAFFPEEEASTPVVPANIAEMLQALSVDAVVLLRSGYGAVAELSELARFPEVMARTLCFVDKATADSYSSRGVVQELRARYGNIRTYTHPDDVEQCRLLDETAEYVRLLQFARFLKGLEG